MYAQGCIRVSVPRGPTSNLRALTIACWHLVFQAEKSFQMIAKHLQTIPVPPSELALHVPASLVLLVLSCLAKNPQDRPQSAGEQARALALIDVSVRGAKKKLRGGGP